MAGAGGEAKSDECPLAAAEEEEGAAAAAPSYLVRSAAPDEEEITARLSNGFVEWILNRKWVSFEEDPDEHYDQMINDPDRPEEYTQEYLEEERDMMRELVAHNERSRACFEKFQQWVRRQLVEKGYVEVGEAYIAQCAINRRSVSPEQ